MKLFSLSFCTLFFLISIKVQALELNYRLLDRPHIQSFIDNQLDSINNRFTNFLINVIGIEANSELIPFIKNFNGLSVLVTLFRRDCIYSLLEAPTSSLTQNESCKEIGHQLLSQIRSLEEDLLKSINRSNEIPAKLLNTIYNSNPYIYLHFALTNTISKLEPSIASVTLVNQSRTQVADQFSLEIGNQLSILHKIIRQSITSLVPLDLRNDLESFWLFYINVLQERANDKERRDYWAVNIFDLNIKVNEFFYSCERNKKSLSRESYNLCDDIHKDWNNILRQTLKF